MTELNRVPSITRRQLLKFSTDQRLIKALEETIKSSNDAIELAKDANKKIDYLFNHFGIPLP